MIIEMLPTSLKKDSDMKIDKASYKDRKERRIGMTSDRTSQPDKVFFCRLTFFVFYPHCTHWQVTQATTQTKTCQRVQFCLPIINLL